MWLTDAELADYLRELSAITQSRLANAPGNGRRRRMRYTVLLPAPEDQGDQPPPRGTRKRKRKTEKGENL